MPAKRYVETLSPAPAGNLPVFGEAVHDATHRISALLCQHVQGSSADSQTARPAACPQRCSADASELAAATPVCPSARIIEPGFTDGDHFRRVARANSSVSCSVPGYCMFPAHANHSLRVARRPRPAPVHVENPLEMMRLTPPGLMVLSFHSAPRILAAGWPDQEIQVARQLTSMLLISSARVGGWTCITPPAGLRFYGVLPGRFHRC